MFAVLCVCMLFSNKTYAADETEQEDSETENIVLEEGLKAGMKTGYLKGLKNGLAKSTKNGLTKGELNAFAKGLKLGLKNGNQR